MTVLYRPKFYLITFTVFISLFLFPQCKNPIGWIAYGPHIEFTGEPTIQPDSGAVFSIDPAMAELTMGGGEIPTGNMHYFCGPRGLENPGTLYCSESEMIALWNSAGFVETVASQNVFPYSPLPAGMGFSGPSAPVLVVYAVAHMSYRIDGGKELDPWRVSSPATVDMSPYLDITVPGIPQGTTALKIDLGGFSQTFSGSGLSSGGSQTFRLTGLLLNLGTSSLSVTSFDTIIPTGSLSTSPHITLTMGTNSTTTASLSGIVSHIPVQVKIGNNIPAGNFSGRYKIGDNPAETTFDNSSAPNGLIPSVAVSSSDIAKTGYFIVKIDGVEYKKTFSVRDLLLESIHSGTCTVNISPLGLPTLLADSCTSDSISFTWSAVNNAAFYKLYRNDGIVIGPLTGTSYTDTGLSAGTEYGYRISAVNSQNEEGEISDLLSVRICTVVLDSNGGSGGNHPDKIYCLKDRSVVIPAQNNTRLSSTPSGNWNTMANGTGVAVAPGIFNVSGDISLYADWQLNTITGFKLTSTGGGPMQPFYPEWDYIDVSVCSRYEIIGTPASIGPSYSFNIPNSTQIQHSNIDGYVYDTDYQFTIRWFDHSGRASSWYSMSINLQ